MLVSQGWNVYGTSRKAKEGEASPKDGGHMVCMDVTDEKSVKDAIGLGYRKSGKTGCAYK